MYLYNTLRRRPVEFEPVQNRVGLYVCGITPYDGGHLGHAFTYHTFDILVRRLRQQRITVRSVRNITDVDDSILGAARERGIDYRELGDRAVALFDHDMEALGILPVDAAPRPSEHVPAMVQQIERLMQVGSAYAVQGWVYFDVSTFPRYGRLSELDSAAMLALSRERGGDPNDARKHNPLDFVLWQPSLVDEPRWQSPWSEGRPGWHIECSVLSDLELGLPIDIHGGGADLIYPHHESEIAQTEALGVETFCRHWMHVAMVGYHGEKMSKSLGNLVFVHDLLQRTSPAAIRLMLCAQHYRSEWEYREDLLSAAGLRQATYVEAIKSGGRLEPRDAIEFQTEFHERIDDDLDTPGALGVLDIAAKAIIETDHATTGATRTVGTELLGEMLDLLGVL